MFRVRDKIAQLPLSTMFDHFGGIILSTLSRKVGQVSVCPIRSFTGVVIKYQFVKSFAVIRCVLYVSGARQCSNDLWMTDLSFDRMIDSDSVVFLI